MTGPGCFQRASWRRTILLAAVATVAASSAAAAESLAIVPVQPSADQSIELLVTHDAYSPCGAAVTLAPFEPDSDDILVLRAFVSFEGGGCPAVELLETVRFGLGRLDPGPHRINLYNAAFPGFPAEVIASLSFVVTAGGATDRLLLQGGRFEAEVAWRDFAGSTGAGYAVPGAADDSGLFWFFAPDNWELLVKVLDGCGVNGHYWVLGSGATNVQFSLEVRDTLTGATWTHLNPLNAPAGTWFDTNAFPCAAP